MVTVTRRFSFDAAHHLPHYDGKCHNLHGHTYVLDVTVTGEVSFDKNDPKQGMIIDFGDLKKIVNDNVVERYDHQNLNKFFENPTAECMVMFIGEMIEQLLPEGVHLVCAKLWEKYPSSYATYIPAVDIEEM